MSRIQDRVKTGLDESRMLVLGAQVLLGFGFRAPLENGSAPRWWGGGK